MRGFTIGDGGPASGLNPAKSTWRPRSRAPRIRHRAQVLAVGLVVREDEAPEAVARARPRTTSTITRTSVPRESDTVPGHRSASGLAP